MSLLREPRPDELLNSNKVKELCGNDTVSIKIYTKEGEKVTWKDIIDKKYLPENLITVMVYSDGTKETF